MPKQKKSNATTPPRPALKTPDGRPFKVQHSWNTNDDYEVELRRVRAVSERFSITPAPGKEGLFRDYTVHGAHGSYTVELRSLTGQINTCTCKDFQKNFLGTCKHIEAVLLKTRGLAGKSPFYEIFMGRSPYQPFLLRPAKATQKAAQILELYFDRKGALLPGVDVVGLLSTLEGLPESSRSAIRISQEVYRFADTLREKRRMEKLRGIVKAQLEKNHGALPFLKERLYDYQQEGLLHLAFKGRAILADDMGLGKTVQAVAASAVMREMLGLRRVLVVSPTSLKLEWEEQIRKFTDFQCEAVYGNRPQRLDFYRNTTSFFVLMNYEQVIRDAKEIMELLHPDLLILDEAQRIKNWTTLTSRTLKAMDTPYVFVLTGTPLENRIDDIYSLAELVDPTIFGSLFRFNRLYYKFDEYGKVRGMQHLDELHARLAPIMLRRRKADVALKLPPRTDRTIFVGMTQEQRKRYAEHEYLLNIIVNIMKKRPLTPDEFQRMQLHLASMRMLCDSCYIMDPKVKASPKLDEVMVVLQQYLNNEPERKIIIFSEWVRMLELLKERLDDEGILYVEHTGGIAQQRRRELLQRFKNDPDMHILLCSEAGGTGLNLQQASVVFNLDLPWNPAKLEQRIARSWRNKQERNVDVVNFIAENSIEHNMLATLKFKSGLSDVVLDGMGDSSHFEEANAKEVFLQRLRDILSTPQAAKPNFEERVRKSKAKLSRVLSLSAQNGPVLMGIGEATDAELTSLADNAANTIVISPEMLETLKRLASLGIIAFNEENMKCIYDAGSSPAATRPDPETERRRTAALACLEKAKRPIQMAKVLASNGFDEEVPGAIWKASTFIGNALALCIYAGDETEMEPMNHDAFTKLLDDAGLDAASRRFLELSHENLNAKEKGLQKQCDLTLETVAQFIRNYAPKANR